MLQRAADVQPVVRERAHDKDIDGRPAKKLRLRSAEPETTENESSSDSDEGEREVLDLISHIERDAQSDHKPARGNAQKARSQARSDTASESGTKDVSAAGDELDGEKLRLDLKSHGPQQFLHKYLIDGDHSVRALLAAFGLKLPRDFDLTEDLELLSILQIYIAREFNKRTKLTYLNNLADIAAQLKKSSKVIVITGAGISTSLGIPDFRSENGIYSRLAKYQLSDPQELFDIDLFRHDPTIFYDFCKELLPEDRGYSPTHAFIRLLQDKGILLRQYTQNIDDIESSAGIKDDRLVQCHGSFKTARCGTCRNRVPGASIFPEIKAGRVPKCQKCSPSSPDPRQQDHSWRQKRKRRKRNDSWVSSSDEDEVEGDATFGVMKPDITFFGEQLDTSFKDQITLDRTEADMLICIGTSLRVAPVAEIPNLMPKLVPQVFISREAAGLEYAFDVELLGDCDEFVRKLAVAAGWQEAFEKIVRKGKVKG